jgi:putative oxidoreductase
MKSVHRSAVPLRKSNSRNIAEFGNQRSAISDQENRAGARSVGRSLLIADRSQPLARLVYFAAPMSKYEPYAYALLRIMAGLMFAIHGSQKLLGWPASNMHPPLLSSGGIGGIIELVAGLLIALGLFASWPAFIASGEMAVAYFWKHAPGGWNPVANKGEAAVLYCFLFLYIWTRGSGVLSLDNLLRRNRTGASASRRR